LFQRVKETLASAGFGWEKLASVPTEGGSKEYGGLQDRRNGGLANELAFDRTTYQEAVRCKMKVLNVMGTASVQRTAGGDGVAEQSASFRLPKDMDIHMPGKGTTDNVVWSWT
jgi:hypothetical protein